MLALYNATDLPAIARNLLWKSGAQSQKEQRNSSKNKKLRKDSGRCSCTARRLLCEHTCTCLAPPDLTSVYKRPHRKHGEHGQEGHPERSCHEGYRPLQQRHLLRNPNKHRPPCEQTNYNIQPSPLPGCSFLNAFLWYSCVSHQCTWPPSVSGNSNPPSDLVYDARLVHME